MYPIYSSDLLTGDGPGKDRAASPRRQGGLEAPPGPPYEQEPGFRGAAGLGASDRVGGLPAAGPPRRGKVSALGWLGYLLAVGLVALWFAAVAFGHDSTDGRDWRSDAPDVTEQLR